MQSGFGNTYKEEKERSLKKEIGFHRKIIAFDDKYNINLAISMKKYP